MANSTFIQVPANVSDATALKRFLEKLILQLDIAFGNRGASQFGSSSSITALSSDISSIRELITEINKTTSSFEEYVEDTYEPKFEKNTAFNKEFGTTSGTVTEGGTTTNNPKQSGITSLTQTISDPPTQAEVQDISNKIDEILQALRDANIIDN